MTLSNRKRNGTRSADGKLERSRTAAGKLERLKPSERQCEKCSRTYQPKRNDARTCGITCPGRPDEIRTCINPRCELSERDEDGRHLAALEFVVRGNSQGKGNQRYCS